MSDELSHCVFIAAGAVVVIFFVQIIIVLKRYRKVWPNQAMIITGAFTPGGSRVILEGGAFVWPFVQEAHFLSLGVVPVEVQTAQIYTKAGVPVVGTAEDLDRGPNR
jgi:flotillin